MEAWAAVRTDNPMATSSPFGNKPAFSSGGRRSTRRSGHLPDLETDKFRYGTVNYPEPQDIPRGAAYDALNFITRGSKVETRNGYEDYGPEINGSSKATIFTAHTWDGAELVYKASGDSLYYDSDGEGTWVEVGTNILAGNNGETISFAEYFSPAGAQLWVSSTHTDLIKILTANPGSYKSQYNSSKNFKGIISIKKSRMTLWNYLTGALGKTTKNTIQGSYIDAQKYTTVSNESIGAPGSQTYSGTLATITGVLTAFAVVITDGHEQFVDDYMGNLVGSLGGTGTINYTTGAYSVSFATVAIGPVVASYEYEDSTNNGIADFSHDEPRTAGQGFALPQATGGPIKMLLTIDGDEYAIHERNAWIVSISDDDTTVRNEVFREQLGILSEQGAVATADGIYYVDTSSKPKVSLLTLDPISSLILPRDLSSTILDLSGLVFDNCIAYQWDVFILFACRTLDSIVNNRVILLNTEISGSNGVYVYDFMDFYAQSFATKDGTLLAGDSITASVYRLFANFDDNDSIPNYYWKGGIDDYGIPTLKRARKMWYEGEIDINQEVGVFVAPDRGSEVQIGTISGSGVYVDTGQAVLVGSLIVGYNAIGGGGNGKTAFHYLCEIRMKLGKYQNRQIIFRPTGIGYFSFSRITDHDIVFHQDKLPQRYRAAP